MPTTYIDPASIPRVSLPSYAPNNLPQTGGTRTSNSGGGALGGIGKYGSMFDIPGLPGMSSIASFGSGDTLGGVLSLLGIPGGGMLSSLFGGGDKGGFTPYQDPNTGQWVFSEHRNPVPVATVPGAGRTPDKNYQRLANRAQALQTLMPYLTGAVNSGILPTALENLNAASITSPAYAELMTNLYNTYGPQLNEIGNAIQRQNALAQAGTENAVLTGPGTDLVKNAYNLQQVFDKPYYDTRQTTANRLGDLMNSIDLSGGLSDVERREIEQGLAREGASRGTLGAPSESQTVANAMRYGQAGYQRKQDSLNNLSKAIASASAFLPTAKSGVDVFQTATGRSSGTNPGNSLFTGINRDTGAGNAFGLAGSILGNMSSESMNTDTINSQKKDWLDQFNQFSSGLSNLGGMFGKVAGV